MVWCFQNNHYCGTLKFPPVTITVISVIKKDTIMKLIIKNMYIDRVLRLSNLSFNAFTSSSVVSFFITLITVIVTGGNFVV